MTRRIEESVISFVHILKLRMIESRQVATAVMTSVYGSCIADGSHHTGVEQTKQVWTMPGHISKPATGGIALDRLYRVCSKLAGYKWNRNCRSWLKIVWIDIRTRKVGILKSARSCALYAGFYGNRVGRWVFLSMNKNRHHWLSVCI